MAPVNLTGRSPMTVALPFLVTEHLGADARALGLLQSTFAIGSVLGAVCQGRLRTIRRLGLVISSRLMVVGATTVVLGLATTLLGVLGAMLVMGIALSTVNLTWTYLLQERGRVISLGLLSSNGLLRADMRRLHYCSNRGQRCRN